MTNNKTIPRFLLTAAASGSGKTLITCGILQALKNRGLQVASFKCGPDYIDPMFHTQVIGTKSRNLDTFFTADETVRYLLQENAKDCDVAVIEGVMGYYDGLAGITSKASAWDVAGATKTPAVFIMNCKGMSVSMVPAVKGFLEYRKDSHIRGVILNRISPMLYPRMKKLLEEQLPVKVYGYVPDVKDCLLESRHLGLVMPEEIDDIRGRLQRLSEVIEQSVDLDGLLALAGQVEVYGEVKEPEYVKLKDSVRIALAKDEAFCFAYEDNLELLRKMGAEIVEFSPIHDRKLPENIDGMLLIGGYPELHGKALSANETMRQSVCEAIQNGLPYMAECGGFMYLHDEMEDMDGNFYPMAGVIPGKVFRTPRLTRFGYITLTEGTCFGKEVGPIPAHEFHYFDSENCGSDFLASKPESTRNWRCIHSDASSMAGYPHLYYYGNPKVAEAFLGACLERKSGT